MELFSDDDMESLKEGHVTALDLYNSNLSKISSGGVVTLASLKHLNLCYANVSSHCDILLQLHHLNTIKLVHCRLIQSIPNLPANVTSITVFECESLVNLPCNISELKSLTILEFMYCPKLGSEDPHFLMKVTRLTNLTHLTMDRCGVSQVPSEIGNLVSLKELDLSNNPFCSLPDSLSNLSQLLFLNINSCDQLMLLPLLPPNLTNIYARWGLGYSSDSLRTKVNKESPFSNRLLMRFSPQKEVPDWCSYRSWGDVLSFVAPLNLEDNICGFILCANISSYNNSGISNLEMHNKTKNTTHSFEANTSYANDPADYLRACLIDIMCVMLCPLDDLTLLVEPGDSVSVAVVLKVPLGSVSSCRLRLIYEGDVVDSKLVFQTPSESMTHITSHGDDYSYSDDDDDDDEATPHIPSETIVTQFLAISNHSQFDDYFSSQDEDEPTPRISLEMPTATESYPLSSPLELRLF